jgi:hypothetical protein
MSVNVDMCIHVSLKPVHVRCCMGASGGALVINIEVGIMYVCKCRYVYTCEPQACACALLYGCWWQRAGGQCRGGSYVCVYM